LSATNDSSELVRIDGLVKRFGHRVVLDQIDLTVHAGEVVVLVGPSGTGKSTLLRCINALEDFQEGSVLFEGKPVGRGRAALAARRRVGMIFQSFNLYPHLTALQNVTLAPVKVHGVDKKEAESRARELFAKVRLEHRADAYPTQLSGGEQQRVAIARALATRPSLLLFDEPTSALDPETVGDVLSVMEQLAREGRTMVIVTHEIGFARRVGHRIVFMDGGRIVEEGRPADIIDNAKAERARQFFGSILRG